MQQQVSKINDSIIVSFRLECAVDMLTTLGLISELVDKSHKVLVILDLDKGGLPIVEPVIELMLSKSTLKELLTMMAAPGLDLHVGIQTMRPTPLKENSMRRDFTEKFFNEILNETSENTDLH